MLLHPVLSLSPFPSLISNRSVRFPPLRRHFAPRRAVQCAAAASGGDEFTAKSGYLFELSATEADSLAEYRISKIAAIYGRKPLLVARRLVQTGLAFGKWFGLRYIDSLLDRSETMFQVSLRSFYCACEFTFGGCGFVFLFIGVMSLILIYKKWCVVIVVK